MALNIESADGSVQVVMSVETLESILSRFPGLTVFQMPLNADDLPTYGFAPKSLHPDVRKS